MGTANDNEEDTPGPLLIVGSLVWGSAESRVGTVRTLHKKLATSAPAMNQPERQHNSTTTTISRFADINIPTPPQKWSKKLLPLS